MQETKTSYLAVDLGAESGRAVLGIFDGKRLQLQEIARFPNGPFAVGDTLRWNAAGLFDSIQEAIGKAFRSDTLPPSSLGLDTWGVDFGLLDARGDLIDLPYHYRDARTNGIMDALFAQIPREEVFQHTGLQFMQFNTLFQLFALKRDHPDILEKAAVMLMMPDLFNYWLTGRQACERTIASTSQCYDPQKRQWAYPLLEKAGIPGSLFPEIASPGTVLGPISSELAKKLGIPAIPVILPGCHDTASAVAAVPVSEEFENDFAYISSGTWSLIGAELSRPVVNRESLAFNMTNEVGVQDTIRFLKNLSGLWLVQECRRTWKEKGEDLNYDQITQLAAEAPAFQSLVDPDDPLFLAPGDMPARFLEYCRRTGQAPPVTKGAIVRCALESVALKTRWVIDKQEALLGRKLRIVHIVGGGTQNRLLNQLIANAAGRTILTGPVEATAIGNILMQMLAQGCIPSLREGRNIVRNSFPIEAFQPEEKDAWQRAYERFQSLIRIGDF